jgi:hypothetical protein
VFVRAFDRRQLIELDGLDIAGCYRELFESAVLMGRDALLCFDVDEAEAGRVEAEYRARDAERLQGQSKTGDLHTLKDRMFTPENAMEDAAPDESG